MLRLNAAAIFQIDEEIQRTRGPESEDRIRELRGRRNLLVPLGQLPPEILGPVMCYSRWRNPRSTAKGKSTMGADYRRKWPAHMLACKFIRDAALHTPELWTIVTDTRTEDGARWAALCAKRAGALPLTIIASSGPFGGTYSLPYAIWKEASSIEMIDTFASRQKRDTALLNQPFPRLRHLCFEGTRCLSPQFLGGRCASLTSLSLVVPHATAYPQLPALVYLSVRCNLEVAVVQDVRALIAMLAHTPLLQTLKISLSEELRDQQPPSVDARLVLPHLRTLSLWVCMPVLVTMLNVLPKPSESLLIQCQGIAEQVASEVLEYTRTFWLRATSQPSLPDAWISHGSRAYFMLGKPFHDDAAALASSSPRLFLQVVLGTRTWVPLTYPIRALHLSEPAHPFKMAALGKADGEIRQITLVDVQTMGALPHDLDAWVRQRAAGENKLGEVVVFSNCEDEVRDRARRWEADGVVGRVLCKA